MLIQENVTSAETGKKQELLTRGNWNLHEDSQQGQQYIQKPGSKKSMEGQRAKRTQQTRDKEMI